MLMFRIEIERQYNDLCKRAGTHFQPMVFESQGGMAREAGAVINKIAAAVASAKNREAAVTREEILKRISLIIARSGVSSFE